MCCGNVFSGVCLCVCLSVCKAPTFQRLDPVHFGYAGKSPEYPGQVKVKVTEKKILSACPNWSRVVCVGLKGNSVLLIKRYCNLSSHPLPLSGTVYHQNSHQTLIQWDSTHSNANSRHIFSRNISIWSKIRPWSWSNHDLEPASFSVLGAV